MEQPKKRPTKLDDFKAQHLSVSVSTNPKDEADAAATKSLLEYYTQEDGFHCPRCGAVITNPDEAVYHLAEEINKSLAMLGKEAV
ncbi:hypothetical protein ES703_98682 [subsurface metagenome]